MTTEHLLYGLRLATDLPLSAPHAENPAPADLAIFHGEDLSGNAAPPEGELWANAVFGNGYGVRLTRTADGWSLFYPQTGEFRLNASLDHGTAHALPGRADLLPLLLAGSVPSWVLHLRGEPALHASAVVVGDAAVAFIGASGMGKTTLAALCCRAGASFVTDDVLRLRADDDGFRCYPGAGELRLRPNVASLAEGAPEHAVNRSADGRTTLRPTSDAPSLPRLRAVFIPQPSRTIAELQCEWLRPVDASFQLNAFPRVYGWQVDAPRRRQFEWFARLAQRVPVFRLTVPWGPPFAPTLAAEIFSAAELQLPTFAPA